MRLGEAYDQARGLLRASGVDTPDLDARVLTAAAAGIAPSEVFVARYRLLDAETLARIENYLARRLAREPVARILGRKEFWGLDFALSPTTLVPRPETETLVETALEIIDRTIRRDRSFLVADLGTGSGAILVALLVECRAAMGIGIDRSEKAAAMARKNARRHSLSERAYFLVGNWAEAFASGVFDLIVSNPPYVPRGEIAGLEPEVARHDPGLALDGGEDGLEAYRVLLPSLRHALKPGGHALLEVGDTQAEAVASLLGAAGFRTVDPPRRDLAGRARVVAAAAP